MNPMNQRSAPRQRGRLVFGPAGVYRADYRPAPGGLGWMAVAPCALGDHYLAPDDTPAGVRSGRVVERTALPYLWPSRAAAEAAIAQLARQQEGEPEAW